MKEYWYAYKHQRGFGIGCQPSGFLKHDETRTEYGAVCYSSKLADADAFQYDLELIEPEICWMDIIRRGVD